MLKIFQLQRAFTVIKNSCYASRMEGGVGSFGYDFMLVQKAKEELIVGRFWMYCRKRIKQIIIDSSPMKHHSGPGTGPRVALFPWGRKGNSYRVESDSEAAKKRKFLYSRVQLPRGLNKMVEGLSASRGMSNK